VENGVLKDVRFFFFFAPHFLSVLPLALPACLAVLKAE